MFAENKYKILPLAIKISVFTAFIGGILTPLLETIRRWHQLTDLHYFMHWFDDYIIGGFLLYAAWSTFKLPARGIKYLIASWGFATGMIFYSFFGQLQILNIPDPVPVSSIAVFWIKGCMFLICIVCLILSLSNKMNDVDKK